MDREAAKRVSSALTAGSTLTADQLEFIDMVIDELTDQGAVDPRRLYEAPFTNMHPSGLRACSTSRVAQIVSILCDLDRRAA